MKLYVIQKRFLFLFCFFFLSFSKWLQGKKVYYIYKYTILYIVFFFLFFLFFLSWCIQRSSDATNIPSAEWSHFFSFPLSFSQSFGSFLILNSHLLPLLFHHLFLFYICTQTGQKLEHTVHFKAGVWCSIISYSLDHSIPSQRHFHILLGEMAVLINLRPSWMDDGPFRKVPSLIKKGWHARHFSAKTAWDSLLHVFGKITQRRIKLLILII